jgi:hypothetical protein
MFSTAMAIQEIYTNIGIPILTILQLLATYWVYKAQREHRDALDAQIKSLREYVNDLRGQLTDQKNMVDTATQLVPLLKASYQELQSNKEQQLQLAKDELEKVQATVAKQRETQLQEVSDADVNPALGKILNTIIEQASSTQEQLTALTSYLGEVASTNQALLASPKELLLRTSPISSQDYGPQSGEDVFLHEMYSKVAYQRIKYSCSTAIHNWIKKEGLHRDNTEIADSFPDLIEECKKIAPYLLYHYKGVFTHTLADITRELAREVPNPLSEAR